MESKAGKGKVDGSADLVMPKAKRPDLIKTTASTAPDGKDKATVGLSDCLVCSGCVTSAETILLEQHSLEEFLKRAPVETTVVSISPFVRVGLAQKWGISSAAADARL